MIHAESPPLLPGVMEENREKSRIRMSGQLLRILSFELILKFTYQ